MLEKLSMYLFWNRKELKMFRYDEFVFSCLQGEDDKCHLLGKLHVQFNGQINQCVRLVVDGWMMRLSDEVQGMRHRVFPYFVELHLPDIIDRGCFQPVIDVISSSGRSRPEMRSGRKRIRRWKLGIIRIRWNYLWAKIVLYGINIFSSSFLGPISLAFFLLACSCLILMPFLLANLTWCMHIHGAAVTDISGW